MKMCAQRKAGRGQRAKELRLPSVPFPWSDVRSDAVHHRSLAFRARLYHAKNEVPEEEAVADPYQFSSMERATQAWAETSIGGVALSRSGISLMISALHCKYSTKMQTYKNKNRMTVWSQLWQKYFHVHLYTMGE